MSTSNLKIQLTVCALFVCTLLAYGQSYSSINKSRGYNSSGYLDSARYWSEKNPSKAINYINKVIELSLKENNREDEAAAYVILGNIQQRLGQHDLAIGSFKKTVGLLSENQDQKKTERFSYEKKVVSKAKTSNVSSNNETLFLAYKEMASSYLALNKLQEADNAISYCNYGGFYNVSHSEKMEAQRLSASIKLKQKKVTVSLTILETVYNDEVKNGNLYGQAITNIAIGKVYEEKKDEKAAINYYTKAKEQAEKNNFNKLAIEANDLLAKIYRLQKNVDKEVEVRTSIIQLNSKPGMAGAVKKENLEIGNAYFNNDQIGLAEEYYSKADAASSDDNEIVSISMNSYSASQKAEPLFDKSKELEGTADAYKLLTEEYLKRKDVKKATDYFNEYSKLQDSIKNKRQHEFENAISLSNSIGQNQQRLNLLEKERDLSKKSIEILEQDRVLKEKQIFMRNIVIGTLVLLILLMSGGGYFVYKSLVAKKKAHQILALKSLRGQMNPHFIFNALNSVNHYIAQNDERLANRYLSDFSKLMRLVMDTSKHDFINVTEELEMLKIYLQLEHLRFNDKFDYILHPENSTELSDYELPPMLVQPYIENAIWHGLRYSDIKGILKVTFETENNHLMITISDNGIGRKKSKELKTENQKKQLSVGMQNIENRIQLMNEIYKTNIKVEISDFYPEELQCGTMVKLYIPQKQFEHA